MSNTSSLNLFLTTLGTGSLGRIEKKLDQLIEDVRSGRREETVLTMADNDEDDAEAQWDLWKGELLEDGFTKAEIESHKNWIRAKLRELIESGGLHEEPPLTNNSKQPDPGSEEPNQQLEGDISARPSAFQATVEDEEGSDASDSTFLPSDSISNVGVSSDEIAPPEESVRPSQPLVKPRSPIPKQVKRSDSQIPPPMEQALNFEDPDSVSRGNPGWDQEIDFDFSEGSNMEDHPAQENSNSRSSPDQNRSPRQSSEQTHTFKFPSRMPKPAREERRYPRSEDRATLPHPESLPSDPASESPESRRRYSPSGSPLLNTDTSRPGNSAQPGFSFTSPETVFSEFLRRDVPSRPPPLQSAHSGPDLGFSGASPGPRTPFSNGESERGFSNPEAVFEELLRDLDSRSERETRNSYIDPQVNLLECPLSFTLEEFFTGIHHKVKLRLGYFDMLTAKRSFYDQFFEMDIKPGLKKGSRIEYRDVGPQTADRQQDVHFIVEEKEHPFFKRVKNDIHCTVTLSLGESLCGFRRSIPTIDGKQRSIERSRPTPHGYAEKVPGFGMPLRKNQAERGDFIIDFVVEYPLYFTEEEKLRLGEILDGKDVSRDKSPSRPRRWHPFDPSDDREPDDRPSYPKPGRYTVQNGKPVHGFLQRTQNPRRSSPHMWSLEER